MQKTKGKQLRLNWANFLGQIFGKGYLSAWQNFNLTSDSYFCRNPREQNHVWDFPSQNSRKMSILKQLRLHSAKRSADFWQKAV